MQCVHWHYPSICFLSALGKFSQTIQLCQFPPHLNTLKKLWMTVLKSLSNFQIHMPFKNILFFSPHFNFCNFSFYKALWKCQLLSRVQLFVTPRAVAQAPLSMEFSRQEYWSRLVPFPSPGDLPDPENEPGSPALQVDSLLSEPPEGLQGSMKLFKKELQ